MKVYLLTRDYEASYDSTSTQVVDVFRHWRGAMVEAESRARPLILTWMKNPSRNTWTADGGSFGEEYVIDEMDVVG